MTEKEMYDAIAVFERSEWKYAKENYRLNEENDKLRKLCKDMLFQLCFPRRPQTVAESVKLGHEMHEIEVRAANLGIKVTP